MRTAPVALLALFASCTGSPPAGPSPQRTTTTISAGTSTGSISQATGDIGTRVTFSQPADQVWLATQVAYASLGIDAGIMEPQGWVYGTRRLVASRVGGERASRLVNCGTGAFGAPAADSYAVSFTVASSVEPRATGTQVVTWMAATARPRGTAGDAVQCTSRGRLEAMINAEITSRLRSPR